AWTRDRTILATVGRRAPAPPQLPLDTGSGCGNRRADLSGLDGGPGRPLLPPAAGPTSPPGWRAPRRRRVGGGDDSGGGPKPVARGIDRAALRFPAPRPVPAAPDLAALAQG